MDLRRINFGIEIETVKRTRERVAEVVWVGIDSDILYYPQEVRAWVKAGGPPAPVWRLLSRIGESDWMLIPSGVTLICMHILGRRKYGSRPDFETLRHMVLFFFAAIAATGIAVLIVKYSLGFSRPSVAGERPS